MNDAHCTALRVVLDHSEAEGSVALRCEVDALRREVEALRRSCAEAKEACPALFAEVGERFRHGRRDDMDGRYVDLPDEIFEYAGRTEEAPRGAPHAVPAGWLIFRHVEGPWGIEEGYGAVNGGVRDAVGAWPHTEYRVYDGEGNFEKGVMCLPPVKCRGFRVVSRR